eukprot:7425805-Pyramimonas_sp.AAC.1
MQGARAVLHNSGRGHEWWKEAMQAWCCGRNFTARPCHGVAATLDAFFTRSPAGSIWYSYLFEMLQPGPRQVRGEV